MNIDQLAYCIEVVKTKSITVAANNLMVTQSTISQAITKLEDELALKLFERTRKGVYPIEKASAIFDKMKHVLHTMELIKLEAEYMGEVMKGEFKLSVIPGGVPSVIQSIASLKSIYPELKFELSEKTSLKVINDVRNKEADIGLIAIYEEDVAELLKGLHFYPIDSGVLVACVNKNSKLADKKALILEDFRNQTFVLFNDEFVDPFMKEVASVCGEVDILLRTNNSEVIADTLQQMNIVTIGHEYSMNNHKNIPGTDFVAIPLQMPQRSIMIGWIMEEMLTTNPIVKRFWDKFEKY